MLRILIIALLICTAISISSAQDSAKKPVPVKPNPVHKTNTYQSYRSRVKADSIAKARAQQTNSVKRSTPAIVPAANDNSLNAQYLRLVDKFYPRQEALIYTFWKSASDTLTANRKKLAAAESKLSIQGKTIDSLTRGQNTEDQPKQVLPTKVNSVSIFGMLLPLTTYNLIVWGLIAVFGVAALIVIARSGAFKREARYRTQLYGELEEEFKNYKTKANEKEKKLARELQTERNKLDDLLGR